MITDERINELATDTIADTIRDHIHDRLTQMETLGEDLDEHGIITDADVYAECDRLETALRRHLPDDEGLAALLAAIEQADTDYGRRHTLVLRAVALATALGYDAGIGIDQQPGSEWDGFRAVVYIELPTGQISWHMPEHGKPWDGHTTEQKYQRCREFAARTEQ